MKITFIEESSNISGVQSSTIGLANWLVQKKGIDVEILLPGEGLLMEKCLQFNLKFKNYNAVFPLSSSRSFLNDKYRIPNIFSWIFNISVILLNLIKVKNLLARTKPDIVITKGLYSHIYSGLASRILGIKCICHLQDLITSRYNGILISIFNKILHINSAFIICDGKTIFDNLTKSLKLRSSIILNGINFYDYRRSDKLGLKYREKLKIPKDAYVIGNLSRITPWKGQLEILLPFIQYSKQNPNAYLLIAGSPLFDRSDYLNSIKKMVVKNNISEKVIMPGYENDIKSFFSCIDVYIQPSISKDTSPISLIHSFAAGIPSIISRINSLREIKQMVPQIEQFEIGMDHMLITLFKKYEDVNLRKQIGELNRLNGYKCFDISIHGESFLKKIQEITQN